MSTEVSALGPIDPKSISTPDEEKQAPWIVRKLVGSMTGRIVLSSYESLRAAGTSVVCLSPWGDSSPLLLPCVRFRDLAVHTIIVATGGMAAVAAPVMAPISEVAVSTFGSTILVELGLSAGFSLTTKVANDLVFSKPINKLVPIHSDRLETTGFKVLTITLQFKLAIEDAALGFFKSSRHGGDSSLFSSVKDYVSVEKGWFSPYLYASARRPVIPRTMNPDIVFCHGPFLSGDYRIGETLLKESASAILLCDDPPPPSPDAQDADEAGFQKLLNKAKQLSLPTLSKNLFDRSRSASPEPSLTPLPPPPAPRRMVLVVVGLKPFRHGVWASSKRPGESVVKYILLNGCVAVVVPVKTGAPLVAWDSLTLEELWKLQLPEEGEEASKDGRFEGFVDVLCEYLELCIDWDRVKVPTEGSEDGVEGEGESGEVVDVCLKVEDEEDGAGKEGLPDWNGTPQDTVSPGDPDVSVDKDATTAAGSRLEATLERKQEAVKDAVMLLVAGAVRARASMEIKGEIDEDRAGIAMWRMP